MFYRLLNFIIVIVALPVLLHPSSSLAQCSDQDYIAVFVLSGLEPGYLPMQTELLSVSQVGPSTFPPNSEISHSILQALGGNPNPVLVPIEIIGNMWNWIGVQSSSQALVDQRDGSVLFAGTVAWAGAGEMKYPATSSHSWEFLLGNSAPEPISVATLGNSNWDGMELTSEQLTSMAVEYLRATDVFRSFGECGECGEYVVTGLVYTPGVGALQSLAARLIIAVEGTIGAPWNGPSVPVVGTSWGQLKVLYR